MQKIKDLNLTAFMIIVLFIALLLPTVVSSYVFIEQEKQKQLHEIKRYKEGVGKLLASSLAIPLWEFRVDSAMNVIEPLLKHKRIVYIQVRDLQTGELFVNIQNDIAKGKLFTHTEDIYNDSNLIGELEIAVSDALMQQQLQKTISGYIGLFFFQLVVSVVILVLALYLKIISPIKRLSIQAKKLSNNELKSTFTWKNSDEIGKLGKSFEHARKALLQNIEKIQSQRKRLENIIKGTNVGTWEWNIQTGETVFNERWAQMLGYTLEELQPVSIQTWSALVHPVDKVQSEEKLKAHFRGESEFYEFEGRMKHKNGHWIWILDRGRVTQKDSEGNPLLMAGTHQDITRRKEQERELEVLNERLSDEVRRQVEQITQKDKLLQEQAKLAAMGEMIGAIAHQWRQPLNALSINIQNLEDDYEDGLIDEAFIDEFVHNQTKTIGFMSKTIDDFRNFFKTDRSKTVFSINKVVRSVAHLLQAQLKNHNIELTINDEDFEIDGYKSEMQQVLLNIVSNSKDAILENKIEDGKIDIAIDATAKMIRVCDNGGGVKQESLDRIFEPYFTTKEQGKGTGIGLHMSRIIIVEHMHGKIKAYNKQNGLCIEIGV